MKKYVKPELFYERYELSQHIADCAWEWTSLTNEGTCFASPDSVLLKPYFGYKLFASYDVCTIFREDIEDYCYQNGAPHATLFKS